MEADSVHSVIERAKQCTSIFVPLQWSTVILTARMHDPYAEIPLKYDKFKDLKTLKPRNKTLWDTVDGDSNTGMAGWKVTAWMKETI